MSSLSLSLQQFYLTLTSLLDGAVILKIPVPDLITCEQMGMQYLSVLAFKVTYSCTLF